MPTILIWVCRGTFIGLKGLGKVCFPPKKRFHVHSKWLNLSELTSKWTMNLILSFIPSWPKGFVLLPCPLQDPLDPRLKNLIYNHKTSIQFKKYFNFMQMEKK
jgi:hypothetical protein